MYPYRVVERALARLHGDTGASALRISARVKHFIHLGFTPVSPGKGKRISYTFEDVAKWAYALQLLEYGMDPAIIKLAVQKSWEDVWPAIEKADTGQDDIMFAVPRAISYPNSWAAFEVIVCPSDQPLFATMSASTGFFRRMVLNLSAVSRELWAALEEAQAGMLRDLSEEVARIKAGESAFPVVGPDFPSLTAQADASEAFNARRKPHTPRVNS